MSYILNIHTATETAITSLAENGRVLQHFSNTSSREHAGFLHVAMQQLFNDLSLDIRQLDGIAVNCGPGSYTGIRVGMAAAKGLCYALSKPLIFCNTLELLARAAIETTRQAEGLYGPLVDARRMEVFTALYDVSGAIVMPPAAVVLDQDAFGTYLEAGKVYFMGSGSTKFRALDPGDHAIFLDVEISAEVMASSSFERFIAGKFENVGYASPLYVKEFNSKR